MTFKYLETPVCADIHACSVCIQWMRYAQERIAFLEKSDKTWAEGAIAAGVTIGELQKEVERHANNVREFAKALQKRDEEIDRQRGEMKRLAQENEGLHRRLKDTSATDYVLEKAREEVKKCQ